MIRINLLPADYRRGNRISTKLLGVAFGSALAVAASVGWFGIVYFGQLGEIEHQREVTAKKLEEKKKLETYFDKLEVNRKDYAAHVQTIQDIGKSRRTWARLLDQVIDVINNNGESERHLAWVDSLSVKTEQKTKAATLSMPCAVQGAEFSKVANLNDDFGNAPFREEMASLSPPASKRDLDKTRVPPESYRFTLELKFKPLVQEAPKRRPTPPAPKK